MIDKNDVKMPEQRESGEALKNDAEQVSKIQDLLEKANRVQAEQKLRLDETYYQKFDWFGAGSGRGTKSYFSYQQEAVHDFVFNLNKSGILSDQVGMGKTIEAGMIISELASRNELRSLLIVVPNELMAEKWKDELGSKFGIQRGNFEDPDTIDEDPIRREGDEFGGVKVIEDYDDFCRCVFACVAESKFSTVMSLTLSHDDYSEKEGDTLGKVIKEFVYEDIQKVVDAINEDFSYAEGNLQNIRAEFIRGNDGKDVFYLKNGTSCIAECKYSYDEGYYDKTLNKTVHAISNFVRNRQERGSIGRAVNNSRFRKLYRESLIRQELNGFFAMLGKFVTSIPEMLSAAASAMAKKYPILVVHNAILQDSAQHAEKTTFLNLPLIEEFKNYRHKYQTIKTDEGGIKIEQFYEPYRIIDFFIYAEYQTLIVDEVHDYIGDTILVPRDAYHNKQSGSESYPSAKYDRYELFDDYYFVEKRGLYKKLKSLADRANRKIFLTATPIKSDMIDFYLLTLIASNKDADAYQDLRRELAQDSEGQSEERSKANSLYNDLYDCIESGGVEQYYCDHRKELLVEENASSASGGRKRYKYPYFGGSYLLRNGGDPERIKDYLLGYISYMTYEEVALDLFIAYRAENTEALRGNADLTDIADQLGRLLKRGTANELQARVVFRALLNNTVKMRFEEDFTPAENGYRPIKRIRELLELPNGPRLWNKAYQKYGIRHTRHQTYNLQGCAQLERIKSKKKERYLNLPVWPKRNGRVIYLLRDDVFFDNFMDLEIKRELPKHDMAIQLDDLPNIRSSYSEDASEGRDTDEDKNSRFRAAMAIFDYINDAMSGGTKEGDHKPESIRYDAIGIADADMAEYKLALVTRLMSGSDAAELGTIQNKVLLFAEKDRDRIHEWFSYMGLVPNDDPLITEDGVSVFIDRTRIQCEADIEIGGEARRLTAIYSDAGREAGAALHLDGVGQLDLDPDRLSSDPHAGSQEISDCLAKKLNVPRILCATSQLMHQFRTVLGKIAEYKRKKPEYAAKWKRYGARFPETDWRVTEKYGDLGNPAYKNVLIIIDPTKYAQGLDLQKADTIINFDIDYDPLKMEQRIGRIDRIRPGGRENQNINIISFVPYNDMSGFVINFFANELKMFTQWMGETTGIVSVPRESGSEATGTKNSFGERVKALESAYRQLYRVCTKEVGEQELEEIVDAFVKQFSIPQEEATVRLRALQALRESFNQVFTNSVSLRREGFRVEGDKRRVMRFNSPMGIGVACYASQCASCSHRSQCEKEGGKRLNDSAVYRSAYVQFFDKGIAFYDRERERRETFERGIAGRNEGTGRDAFLDFLRRQCDQFRSDKAKFAKTVSQYPGSETPFTVPIDEFSKGFEPLKRLYWDDGVKWFLQYILNKFHGQCDYVLESAYLFEQFIKKFSVAELMNNMETEGSES